MAYTTLEAVITTFLTTVFTWRRNIVSWRKRIDVEIKAFGTSPRGITGNCSSRKEAFKSNPEETSKFRTYFLIFLVWSISGSKKWIKSFSILWFVRLRSSLLLFLASRLPWEFKSLVAKRLEINAFTRCTLQSPCLETDSVSFSTLTNFFSTLKIEFQVLNDHDRSKNFHENRRVSSKVFLKWDQLIN